jgi:hypothetical protein
MSPWMNILALPDELIVLIHARVGYTHPHLLAACRRIFDVINAATERKKFRVVNKFKPSRQWYVDDLSQVIPRGVRDVYYGDELVMQISVQSDIIYITRSPLPFSLAFCTDVDVGTPTLAACIAAGNKFVIMHHGYEMTSKHSLDGIHILKCMILSEGGKNRSLYDIFEFLSMRVFAGVLPHFHITHAAISY